MIEAAELTGTAEIAIRLGGNAEELDLAALEAAAALIGTVRSSAGRRGHPARHRYLGRTDRVPHTAIAAPYQAAVAAAAVTPSTQRTQRGAHGDIFETTVDGVTLTIGCTRSFIAEAAHHGAASLATTAVLDVFCEELSGLTVQEAPSTASCASSTACGQTAPTAVPGIVCRATPTRCSISARLIRSLAPSIARNRQSFRRKQLHAALDSAWLHLSDEEKVARQRVAERIRASVLDDDVRVIAVEQQVRLTSPFRKCRSAEKAAFIRDSSTSPRTLEPSLQFHERSQRRKRVAPPVAHGKNIGTTMSA